MRWSSLDAHIIANVRELFPNRLRRFGFLCFLDARKFGSDRRAKLGFPCFDLAALAWNPDADFSHQRRSSLETSTDLEPPLTDKTLLTTRVANSGTPLA